jgi:hypothetical protein
VAHLLEELGEVRRRSGACQDGASEHHAGDVVREFEEEIVVVLIKTFGVEADARKLF